MLSRRAPLSRDRIEDYAGLPTFAIVFAGIRWMNTWL